MLVLDSRIPKECRMKELETQWKEKGKKVVLVLAKSDLVPEAVLENWYQELNKEYPTAIFSVEADSAAQSSEVFKVILEALPEHKAAIKVGIVGYPHVGKKSLLKVLNETVKDQPKIELDQKVGTVLGKKEPNSLVIKTVADLEDLADPYGPVHALLKKVPKDEILLQYEIQDYNNTQEFLACVARGKGMLLKGGMPDYDSAARMVLNDWVEGKLRYYQEC